MLLFSTDGTKRCPPSAAQRVKHASVELQALLLPPSDSSHAQMLSRRDDLVVFDFFPEEATGEWQLLSDELRGEVGR